MIEVFANVVTAGCYIITVCTIVKYIHNRFIRHKNSQSVSTPIEKYRKVTSSVEDSSFSMDGIPAGGCEDMEYKNTFLGNYTMKNRIQVYIDRGSYECMKRFLSVAVPDTSMAGYVSRIVNDHIARNATTINKIFEDSRTKLF